MQSTKMPKMNQYKRIFNIFCCLFNKFKFMKRIFLPTLCRSATMLTHKKFTISSFFLLHPERHCHPPSFSFILCSAFSFSNASFQVDGITLRERRADFIREQFIRYVRIVVSSRNELPKVWYEKFRFSLTFCHYLKYNWECKNNKSY